MDDVTSKPATGHRLSTRLWHWSNALIILIMVMSGLTIFNAHPRLYWGVYGANAETPWLHLGHPGRLAFPAWATLPSQYDLAKARRWHLTFAWGLVVTWVFYLLWSVANRHIQRDLAPTPAELTPRHLWQDIKNHARLRFPEGHNTLQKISYIGVLFGLLPGVILSGLTLSPGLTAGWPWLLWVMGGRASARSVHFICMSLIVGFVLVHLIMVLLTNPIRQIRAMIVEGSA